MDDEYILSYEKFEGLMVVSKPRALCLLQCLLVGLLLTLKMEAVFSSEMFVELPSEYVISHPRRQYCLLSLLREPQMSGNCVGQSLFAIIRLA
jgi:hypothetical protein